jgi:hypothetical protein
MDPAVSGGTASRGRRSVGIGQNSVPPGTVDLHPPWLVVHDEGGKMCPRAAVEVHDAVQYVGTLLHPGAFFAGCD